MHFLSHHFEKLCEKFQKKKKSFALFKLLKYTSLDTCRSKVPSALWINCYNASFENFFIFEIKPNAEEINYLWKQVKTKRANYLSTEWHLWFCNGGKNFVKKHPFLFVVLIFILDPEYRQFLPWNLCGLISVSRNRLQYENHNIMHYCNLKRTSAIQFSISLLKNKQIFICKSAEKLKFALFSKKKQKIR